MTRLFQKLKRLRPVDFAAAVLCVLLSVLALVIAIVEPDRLEPTGAAAPAAGSTALTGLQLTRELAPAARPVARPARTVPARPDSAQRRIVLAASGIALFLTLPIGVVVGWLVARRLRGQPNGSRHPYVDSVPATPDNPLRRASQTTERLQATIDERDRQIHSLQQRLARLQGPTAEVTAESTDMELRQELDAANQAVRDLEDLLNEQRKLWSGLEAHSTTGNAQMARLQHDLSAAADIIDALHDDVARWKQRAETMSPGDGNNAATDDRLAGSG